MSWETRASSNEALIAGLLKHGIIKSREVHNAMLAIDRATLSTPARPTMTTQWL